MPTLTYLRELYLRELIYVNYVYVNCIYVNCVYVNCVEVSCVYVNCIYVNCIYFYLALSILILNRIRRFGSRLCFRFLVKCNLFVLLERVILGYWAP